jgi:drug/metabolite transporter (DMT)-like permease
VRWASIALVVVSTVIYQLGQRSIPSQANALVATFGAYVIAMVGAVALVPFLARDVSLASSWRTLNGGTILVGLGALGIEIGYLLAYRAGWVISSVSLTANSMVALALLLIGAVAFSEQITLPRAAGIVLCLAGLWLIARPVSA